MIPKRFFPFLIAILSFIALELFINNSKLIYLVILIVIFLSAYGSYKILNFSNANKTEWLNTAILPILFIFLTILYTIFWATKNGGVLIHLFFIISSLFLFYYFRFGYYYYMLPTHRSKFNFENVSSYGNFVTFFLAAASIYGLQLFLNMPIWILILIIFFITGILIFQMMWIANIDWRKNFLYILLCSLILMELSWSIFYLPFNFNVSGGLLVIIYYALFNLLRAKLNGILSVRLVKLYLIISVTCISIILFTAKFN